MVGATIAAGGFLINDAFIKQAYTFRADEDGDGRKELYLRKNFAKN